MTVLEPLDALALQSASPADATTRWTALPWRARVLDSLSSYLPLLLMGLLALGSWWLVKNTPLADGPRTAVPPTHEPDYTMHRFSVQRFNPQGTLRARIEGDTLRHFPDTDTIEVEQPRIRAYALDGGVTDASARRALSNGDATEVQLLGDARVVREANAGDPGLTFRGEFLHVFLKTEQVRSHLPATVTRGGAVIRADAFTYDNVERTVEMTGHVRASFAAQGSTPLPRR